MTETTLLTGEGGEPSKGTESGAAEDAQEAVKPEAAGAKPPEGQAGEQKADGKDGASKESKDGEKTDKDKQSGAPEQYETFTVPEGIEVDSTEMEKFMATAKEIGLSQEAAQKLVDMEVEKRKGAAEAQNKAWETLQERWIGEAKADKEIGGAEFDANLGYARTAVKTFGSPALAEALRTTGMGNHPEFIRAFAKIGKAISDDGKLILGANKPTPKDTAKVMFPSMN
jgi:hypothetical protein